jgi:uncharacterized protein
MSVTPNEIERSSIYLLNASDPAATRYDTIDLVRGLALLGVALVNVHAFATGWDSHYALDRAAHVADVIVEYVVGLVFAHRSFPVLGFLLGLGISMQWRRTDEAAIDRSQDQLQLRQLRARYVALFLLGIAHALLLWPGDIVAAYALIVLIMLWFWPKTTERLRLWSIIAMSLMLAAYFPAAAIYLTNTEPFPPFPTPSFALPSFIDAWLLHPREFFSYGAVQAMLPEVWASILVGAWLGQSGAVLRWLRGESDPVSTRRWFAFGFALYGLGALLDIAGAQWGAWANVPESGVGMALWVLGLPPALIGCVFVWLSLARAWHADALPLLRELFIAAGRAPLTQFFGQSFVFAIVFNESLLGLHEKIGRAAYSSIACITFFVIARLSQLWRAGGRQRGSMETVWLALAKRL